MGDITISKRNNYTGLDADKPATANIGDTYSCTDTGKKYIWNGSTWFDITAGIYIPRPVSGLDWVETDFTLDGTWKVDGLDASTILPAGAVAAHFTCYLRDNLAAQNFLVRQNATNLQNQFSVMTQVANQWTSYLHFIVACDADRLFDYLGLAAIADIRLAILGYYI